MIRKVAVLLLLIALPAVASAAQPERDMLLTPGGTLYTVERVWADDIRGVAVTSNSYLTLSQRQGDEIYRYIVPGTLVNGVHTNPTLAYDNDTDTLFLFWQHSSTALHSELYFTSFSKGNWTPELTFATARNQRSNLRIAVTRKVTIDGPHGQSQQPEVNVHAVWWEFDSPTGKQSARYALLTIENGQVIPPGETYHLSSFASSGVKQESEPGVNADVFKHPALFATPQQDSVDVIFGSVETSSFTRVRIRPSKPSLDARIRIPVGVKDQPLAGSPRFRATAQGERIAAINADPDRVVFYTRNHDAVHYVMYKNGSWTDMRAIALDSQVTSDAAVEAIRRMISQE